MENVKVNFQWIQNTDENCAQVKNSSESWSDFAIVWKPASMSFNSLGWDLMLYSSVRCWECLCSQLSFRCTGEIQIWVTVSGPGKEEWRTSPHSAALFRRIQVSRRLQKTQKKFCSGKRQVHLKSQMLLLYRGAGKNSSLKFMFPSLFKSMWPSSASLAWVNVFFSLDTLVPILSFTCFYLLTVLQGFYRKQTSAAPRAIGHSTAGYRARISWL